MAITNTAVFPQNPVISTALVVAADDLTSAPANTLLLVTAGVNGAEVSSVTAVPRATVADSCLHLFVSKDTGTTKILIGSVLMSSHTVANDTAIPVTDFGYTETLSILLGANDRLYAGSAVALSAGLAFTALSVDL